MNLRWSAAVWALVFIFTVSLQAQKKSYPNELSGYEFYGRGRLATIKLAESSKQDVEKIFGEACSSTCDFDEKWRIRFEYFGDFVDQTVSIRDKTWDVAPKPQYLGKINSISLFPKSRISLDESRFSSQFNRGFSHTTSPHSKWEIYYDLYRDKYGLAYIIFEEMKSKKTDDTTSITDSSKGDLVEIKYEITDKRQKRIWIKERIK
jgi:hypothetical protein